MRHLRLKVTKSKGGRALPEDDPVGPRSEPLAKWKQNADGLVRSGSNRYHYWQLSCGVAPFVLRRSSRRVRPDIRTRRRHASAIRTIVNMLGIVKAVSVKGRVNIGFDRWIEQDDEVSKTSPKGLCACLLVTTNFGTDDAKAALLSQDTIVVAVRHVLYLRRQA